MLEIIRRKFFIEVGLVGDNCIGHLEALIFNETNPEDEVEALSLFFYLIVTLVLRWLPICCHSPARMLELIMGHRVLFVVSVVDNDGCLASWWQHLLHLWVLSLWLSDLLHGWLRHLWLRDPLFPGLRLLSELIPPCS